MNWTPIITFAKRNAVPVTVAILSTVGLINTVPQVKRAVVSQSAPSTPVVPVECKSGLSEDQMVRILEEVRKLPPPVQKFVVHQKLVPSPK